MSDKSRSRDLAGSFAAAVFILVGALAWWDTTRMSDPDSYVFPRTVILLMVTFSLLLILRNLLRGGGEPLSVEGSWPRRLGLVAVLLGGALAMPLIGFLPAGTIVFMATMLLAMYDPWTRARRVAFPLIGLAVVVAFFVLFAEVLRVPLPVGSLFE